MLRIALTGGIGTGKSEVLASLAAAGIPVIEADKLAHQALETEAVATAIRARFGAAAFGTDGRVDRARLGAIVFADEAARRDLEAMVHDVVYAAIHGWMNEQQAHGARVVVAEIPLLFESGHEGDFDRVIVTACDPALQVERVVTRSGLSADDVRRRIAAQMSLDEKIRRAHTVIRTDGSLADTRARAAAVARALLDAAGSD